MKHQTAFAFAVAALVVACLALPALAAEPSMQVPGQDPLQALLRALPLVWTILLTMGGVATAFYRKDRDALERLFRAVPDIWDAVQQERRQAATPAKPGRITTAADAAAQAKAANDPLGRALQLAAKNAVSSIVERANDGTLKLKESAANQVATKLRAHDERMRAVGAVATPVVVPAATPVVRPAAPLVTPAATR